ncbi:Ig-like domain-containing protein [Streptomyces sp. NBC_01431]|uniref:Ig-like domain-containing protein n=1 Tax=Streptomyces sp. NBC_01431 TaxID=2903863 RepID=UPI002E3046BA|nr:Ig-like domain-containing protein [Streptomyces sp. NBC_01431]
MAGTTGLVAAMIVPLTAAAGAASVAEPCGTGGVFTTSQQPTCAYNSAGTDTFTVPDGVTAVNVDLSGGEGGSAAGYIDPHPAISGAPGGLGGETRATLPVTSGQILQLTVGAAGVPGSSRHGEFARPGGTGHGRGGGGAHGGGGSGGGGSDVRVGAFGGLDRVLVAGGGGGAGNGGPMLQGGAGGGVVGQDGGQSNGPLGSGLAGGGATQTAPGHGNPNTLNGGPGTPGIDLDPITSEPNPGSGGTGGNGGAGGPGGGGGGGGRHGGGGGSGGGNPGYFPGAGGGGGSSYADPSATSVTLLQGVNHGNGKAIVTFQYGTSLTLSADTAAPLFGHAVSVTATVASANPGAGIPTGSVTFSDGTTTLATVPLNGARATFATSKLQPGAHRITATYGGDPTFTASATAAPTDLTAGFTQPCLTDHDGPLTVPADQSLCIAPGAIQNGPVDVQPGGALAVSGAEINGPVASDGALAVTICHSTLHGQVTLAGTSGFVLLGDDEGTDCAGSTFRAPLTLDGNTGGLEVSSNTMSAPVRINDNSGSGLLSEDLVPEFEGNHVGAPLRCAGNSPTLRQSGNTVNGPHSGQCK